MIDWSGRGKAVQERIGVDNVVLEVIREENTLEEFAKAMRDLSGEGWISESDFGVSGAE
ncbi:hypothetical protein [Streptomyces axinellae]|uniref:Uncharacterized protein n=1 Tax=Streptomyces axinellae TaxID=552788 RepID=A0ABN3R1C5_9ACTN